MRTSSVAGKSPGQVGDHDGRTLQHREQDEGFAVVSSAISAASRSTAAAISAAVKRIRSTAGGKASVAAHSTTQLRAAAERRRGPAARAPAAAPRRRPARASRRDWRRGRRAGCAGRRRSRPRSVSVALVAQDLGAARDGLVEVREVVAQRLQRRAQRVAAVGRVGVGGVAGVRQRARRGSTRAVGGVDAQQRPHERRRARLSGPARRASRPYRRGRSRAAGPAAPSRPGHGHGGRCRSPSAPAVLGERVEGRVARVAQRRLVEPPCLDRRAIRTRRPSRAPSASVTASSCQARSRTPWLTWPRTTRRAGGVRRLVGEQREGRAVGAARGGDQRRARPRPQRRRRRAPAAMRLRAPHVPESLRQLRSARHLSGRESRARPRASTSRSLIVRRLSQSFLPRARPISTLTIPRLK